MDQSIIDFWQHYHRRSQSNPHLYRSGCKSIDVILPNNLLHFANAAGGHSGFGAGARARGIRRQCSDSKAELARIFASPENLSRFLETSEKNAEAYVQSVRNRHLKKPSAANRGQNTYPKWVMARDEFWNRYTKNDMHDLLNRYGRDMVVQAYQTLTMQEFEGMFGITYVKVA